MKLMIWNEKLRFFSVQRGGLEFHKLCSLQNLRGLHIGVDHGSYKTVMAMEAEESDLSLCSP